MMHTKGKHLVVKGQQGPGSLADFRQGRLHPPELALVAQAILAHGLQLAVQSLLFKRPPRLLEGLTICTRWETQISFGARNQPVPYRCAPRPQANTALELLASPYAVQPSYF